MVEGQGENWLEEALKTRPFGRMILPADIANAALFFASNELISGAILEYEQMPFGAPSGAAGRSTGAPIMKLAAFPKCFMDQLVLQRSMSVFDWIEMAADLPIDGLELYDGFLETLDEGYLEKVRLAIERRGLKMPMLCCSPDFTQPDPEARRKEIEREKKMIDVTASLGGKFCRVLSGQRRPEISRARGSSPGGGKHR